MSPERNSRKRTEFRRFRLSRVRWIILACSFVLFVLVSFYLYVRAADTDHRRGEKQAMRLAKAESGVHEVTGAYDHTWDEKVWVVAGKDAEGKAMMVWQLSTGPLVLKEGEFVDENAMRAQFAASHEGRPPIRMLPGWFQGEPVWELRYWKDDDRRRQAIDFYSARDGKWLKTYELPG